MEKDAAEKWNERYSSKNHHDVEYPSPLLENWISELPDGKALDVGCGTGRNSIFLAAHDYKTDAIDFSKKGIEIAKKRAKKRNIDVNWILKDVQNYNFTKNNYDVVILSYFHPLKKLKQIKNSVKNEGFILFEHHIETDDKKTRGPENPKFRFKPNELLKLFNDFQIFEYAEGIEKYEDGEISSLARLVARKSKNLKSNLPKIKFQ